MEIPPLSNFWRRGPHDPVSTHSQLTAQKRFCCLKDRDPLKKMFTIGGNVECLRAYQLIPLTSPSLAILQHLLKIIYIYYILCFSWIYSCPLSRPLYSKYFSLYMLKLSLMLIDLCYLSLSPYLLFSVHIELICLCLLLVSLTWRLFLWCLPSSFCCSYCLSLSSLSLSLRSKKIYNIEYNPTF
jgi:hypothetical protein